MPAASAHGLPPPGAEAAAHSRRLAGVIGDALDAAGGWLSFADYMQLALYAPALGYYAAGAGKFGEAGDFVTAPEISPLFAAVCAAEMDSALRALGGGEVLELGPGTGRFAAGALAEFRARDTPITGYSLLEVSPDLRARQQALLAAADAGGPPHDMAPRWLDSLPAPFRGVVFANEVIDALPCERFVMQGGAAWRLGVGRAADAGVAAAGRDTPAFEWRARPADGACAGDAAFAAAMAQRLDDLAAAGIALPEGCCGEFHPQLAAWVASLADALGAGLLLFVDYGLPRAQLLHPDRAQGSLRCHYRHHAHGDPFLWPGLQDITAWVDFTALAEAGAAAGLEVAGFTTQAGFLLGGGIEARLAALDDATRLRLAPGVRRLLLPGEMGEAVKVMALAKDRDALPPAFALQDLRRGL
jgi:SAM-dependent MidA family methyltransferase